MSFHNMTSFEDLGWSFYYDIDGKYPLQEGEFIDLVPGETIEIYYRHPPKQEADGHFYGNAIMAPKAFPFFFFGMYKRKDIRNLLYFFGIDGNENSSLIGKVESISVWSRGLNDSEVLNYHTNQMKLIGSGQAYFYQSNEEAKADGLISHFVFDKTNILSESFDNKYSAIKSSFMNLGSGKTTNASIIDKDGSYIFVDRHLFSYDFSMNFRFYSEEDKDFTIFYSERIGYFWFDSSQREIVMELFPYIGNTEIWRIQYPSFKVHNWYDLLFKYEDGRGTVYINGEKIEHENFGIVLGGVHSYLLDNSNFESIELDVSNTFEVYAEDKNIFRNYNGDKIEPLSFSIQRGAKEIRNLFNGIGDVKTLSGNESHGHISKNIVDDITNKIEYSSQYSYGNFCSGDYYTLWPQHVESKISTNENDSIDFSINIGNGLIAGIKNSGTLWTTVLLPNGYIKITLKVKNELQSSDGVFPMIFSIPGLVFSSKKVKMEGLAFYKNKSTIKTFTKHRYSAYGSTSEEISGPVDGIDQGGMFRLHYGEKKGYVSNSVYFVALSFYPCDIHSDLFNTIKGQITPNGTIDLDYFFIPKI